MNQILLVENIKITRINSKLNINQEQVHLLLFNKLRIKSYNNFPSLNVNKIIIFIC